MAEQPQWEYCDLVIDNALSNRKGWRYDVWVRYFGPGGSRFVSIASCSEGLGARSGVWSRNPWDEALCLLGSAGWEMVSNQLAFSNATETDLAWWKRWCTFKRPVVPGRPVDDVNLAERIKPG